jgi:hypothetical protein
MNNIFYYDVMIKINEYMYNNKYIDYALYIDSLDRLMRLNGFIYD